ncbi:MAG: hypothetical protein ACF8R7_02785 [Phycisphaerales bacterium JB039]
MSRARANSARRRGYALVLVTLLTMVSSMAVAVILQRHAAVRRSVVRQVEQTRQRHIERGLREVISGWLRTVRGDSVADRLGPDGHALDILLPEGRTVSIAMRDAQGAVLAGFDALPQEELEQALALYEGFASRVGPTDLERMTRLVGPARISVATAPPEAVEAAVEAALGPQRAAEIAAEIREAVAEGPVTDSSLRNQTLQSAGVAPADRTAVLRLLTAEPELWELDIRIRSGLDTGRYRAQVVIPRRQSAARDGSVMSFSPLGPFLLWERVEME